MPILTMGLGEKKEIFKKSFPPSAFSGSAPEDALSNDSKIISIVIAFNIKLKVIY